MHVETSCREPKAGQAPAAGAQSLRYPRGRDPRCCVRERLDVNEDVLDGTNLLDDPHGVPAGIVGRCHRTVGRHSLSYSLNSQMSRLFVTSSTAAKTMSLPSTSTASPNAPPSLGSIEVSPTNWPVGVNSTSSLGWFALELTASPLAAIRFPSGKSARPKGPRRTALSLKINSPRPALVSRVRASGIA